MPDRAGSVRNCGSPSGGSIGSRARIDTWNQVGLSGLLLAS